METPQPHFEPAFTTFGLWTPRATGVLHSASSESGPTQTGTAQGILLRAVVGPGGEGQMEAAL